MTSVFTDMKNDSENDGLGFLDDNAITEGDHQGLVEGEDNSDDGEIEGRVLVV